MKSLMIERTNDYLKMEESIGTIRPKKLEDVYSLLENEEPLSRNQTEIKLPALFNNLII